MSIGKKPTWLNLLEPVGVSTRRVLLTPLKVEVLEWRVKQSFARVIRGHKIIVPEGFEHDLASVPAWVWWLYPPHGPYALDATVHDYLYVTKEVSRKEADLIYYELLKRNPAVSARTARIHYLAVRAGGWTVW